jgi:uncharacterized protein (DUF1778 family)
MRRWWAGWAAGIALALACPPGVVGAERPAIPSRHAGKRVRARGGERLTPATPATPAGRPVRAPAAQQAEIGFNSCREIPPGERVKANLKPDADLSELVAWISALTCKQFIVPASSSAASRKITLVAPALITREEAYRVFLDALDSVGLTVEPAGKALQIIESAKAKTASIPVYGFDGRPLLEPARGARPGRQP